MAADTRYLDDSWVSCSEYDKRCDLLILHSYKITFPADNINASTKISTVRCFAVHHVQSCETQERVAVATKQRQKKRAAKFIHLMNVTVLSGRVDSTSGDAGVSMSRADFQDKSKIFQIQFVTTRCIWTKLSSEHSKWLLITDKKVRPEGRPMEQL